MESSSYIKKCICGFSLEGGDSLAFSTFDGKSLNNKTYQQFVDDILLSAGYFKQARIINQHIALISLDSYEWLVSLFAIISSGNIAILINPALPDDALQYQCKIADTTYICGDASVIFQLPLDIECDNRIPYGKLKSKKCIPMDEVYTADYRSPIILMFTSGTMGKSKAVMLTSENLQNSINNIEGMYALPGMERVYPTIPMYHIGALRYVLASLQRYKTICLGRGGKYLFVDMPHLNPTGAVFVPAIIESLAKVLKRTSTAEGRKKLLGTNFHRISYGGAVLKPSVTRYMMEQGFIVDVIYGMTETTCDGTWCVLDERHIGTLGKLCGDMQCQIRNGEIMLKNASILSGYYNDAAETATVVENGWIHTGDLGYCDKDGYFYLTGRKKNVIILSNGENVNPEEIEAQFSKCPEILECLVYGDKKGICADVYTINESAASDFIKKYNEAVPLYRHVYKVYYSSAPLEKTGSGKIKRKENVYV